jgi:hypothetical protein
METGSYEMVWICGRQVKRIVEKRASGSANDFSCLFDPRGGVLNCATEEFHGEWEPLLFQLFQLPGSF